MIEKPERGELNKAEILARNVRYHLDNNNFGLATVEAELLLSVILVLIEREGQIQPGDKAQ